MSKVIPVIRNGKLVFRSVVMELLKERRATEMHRIKSLIYRSFLLIKEEDTTVRSLDPTDHTVSKVVGTIPRVVLITRRQKKARVG